jgi:RNA polymerase sigma factor (sigma-70 family)
MADGVGALYRDHATRVWRYARARLPSDADAEDVTSEVFTRAMASLSRFDPSRGNEAAWITGIARHAVADWWRRRRPEDPHAAVMDGASAAAEWTDPPGEHAVGKDDAGRLRSHLGLLSEREQEAIALRFGAELSSPEIAEVMGTSPTAARMLVHRGVSKLREVVDRG